MTQKHDFEKIKTTYLKDYSVAIRTNKHFLDFDVEDWRSTLMDVHLKIYYDIKSIGVYLYPLYPIGDYFIDFGNPFKKIGIEILYKEWEREHRLECIDYFKDKGWQVYTIESKFVEPSAEEYYRRQDPHRNVSLYDDENMYDFVEEHKSKNSECLIYYIKNKYFSTSVADENDDY